MKRRKRHASPLLIGPQRTDPVIAAIVDASPNFATQLDLATAIRMAGR